MRILLKRLFFVFLFIVPAISAPAQPSFDATEETERKKLSVLLLVDGVVRAIEKQPIPVQFIYGQIETDKHRHQEKRNSYELSQIHVEKKLKTDLKADIQRVFNASGFDGIDPDWFLETEKQALKDAERHIAANLFENFDDSFHQARTRIVKKQQADLIQVAKPQTRQDYLKVEKNAPDLNKELLNRSTRTYKEPIFSENSDYLSEKIDETIVEARQQFNRQREIVSNSRGGGPQQITVESIQKAILSEIELYRSSQKHPYNIFPSVEKAMASKSQVLAIKKFNKWTASVNFKVPENRIKEVIEADIGLHRNKSKSKQLLLQAFLPEIQQTITNDYTNPLSPEEGQRLRHFLEEQPDFYVLLENVAGNSLTGFSAARDTIGREQFQQIFPDLADDSWRLDKKSVQLRYNQDPVKANQIIIQGLLSGKPALEETHVLVEQAVYRLAEKGDDALRQQMSIVEAYRIEVEEKPERLFQGLPDGETETAMAMKKLVETASGEIERTWSEMVLAKDYPHLFETVENQIRKEVKDIVLTEMKSRTDALPVETLGNFSQTGKTTASGHVGGEKGAKGKTPGVKAAGKKIARGDPTGTSGLRSGKKGSTSSIILIDIDLENEKIVIATVEIGKIDSFTFTFPLGRESNKKFQTLVSKQLENFEDRIERYFSNMPEDSTLRFVYCFTRIFHARVPYGLVCDLRERFRKAAHTGRSRKLTLFWYDGFFTDKKPMEIKEIRKRSYRLLPFPS